MPLLNHIPWNPTALTVPPGTEGSQKVFQVRQTGEIFTSYESYAARLRLLQSRQWSSNGKTGLNYEEAVLEDQRAEFWLKEFPKELEEPVVRAAHHSLLPLDVLVNQIHSHHCSPSGSGKENLLEGEKSAPTGDIIGFNIPQDSIRCWLMRAARKESHGAKSLWIAHPEYQRRFQLAEQVPKELTDALAKASEADVRSGDTLAQPSMKSLKQKAEERADNAVSQQQASKAPEDDPPLPPAKSIEEEEAGLREGTHKQALFQVLKAAGADGMTVPQMIQAANERGIREYNDSQKKVIAHALKQDSAFVRVAKSVYALRALVGERPCEVMGRGPKKQAPLSAEGGAETLPNGHAPAKIAGTSQANSVKQSPSKKRKQAENTAEEDNYQPPPLMSLEEEEKRIRPGTVKAAVFAVLKEAGAEGMTVQQIMERAKERGLKEFSESQHAFIVTILKGDPAYVRVQKGFYALRALMGDAPFEAIGRPPKKQKPAKDKAEAPKEDGQEKQSGEQEEVESLTKNQQVERQTRKLVDLHQQALKKALLAQQKAQTQLQNVEQQVATPKKEAPSQPADARPMPSFELTHEQKRFWGDPSNPADVESHHKRIAELVSRMEAPRQEWQAQQARSQEADTAADQQALAKAKRTLASAQKRVAREQAEVATVELLFKEAAKAAHKEQAKILADERRAQEKRCREEARAAERERKKAEALEAKRYPMEDIQLLQETRDKALSQGLELPAEDVPLPLEWLSEQDSAATAGLLSVADLANSFAKEFDLKRPPAYNEMIALLEAGTSTESHEPTQALWALYETLLRLAIEEDAGKDLDWLHLLHKGTVGEILRLYLQSRIDLIPQLVGPAVAQIAGELAKHSLEDLSGHQHQQLLTFMCDDALDGPLLRDALQQRLEDSDDVKREMREAVAEKRGELKGLLEAEKEERRKEKAAKKAKLDTMKKAQEETAAASGVPVEGTPAENGTATEAEAPLVEDSARGEENGTKSGSEEDDEEEPSWELPAELQEFQGDPTDRKGLLVFRQQQQAARQNLEKEKGRWLAAARVRAKEKEAKLRAAQDAERAKARAKTAAEEEVVRQQEAYERELEKFSIRRNPLGLDRMQRRYWWGMAGQRSHVYVEDENGRWAVLSTREEVDALMAALNKRGVRELGLHTALEKAYGSITHAMKRAESKVRPASGEATSRFPKRQRAQPVIFSPSKEAARMQADQQGQSPVVGGLSAAALKGIMDCLTSLQKKMAARGIPEPEEGWKDWSRPFRDAAPEAMASLHNEGVPKSLIMELKTCLIEAEDMLHIATVTANQAALPDPSDSSRESSEEPEEGKRKAACLWRNTDERESWLLNIQEGETLTSIAFGAAQLAHKGTALLSSLEKAEKASTKAAAQAKAKSAVRAKDAAKATDAVKAKDADKAVSGLAKAETKKDPSAKAAKAALDESETEAPAKKVIIKAAEKTDARSAKVTRGKAAKMVQAAKDLEAQEEEEAEEVESDDDAPPLTRAALKKQTPLVEKNAAKTPKTAAKAKAADKPKSVLPTTRNAPKDKPQQPTKETAGKASTEKTAGKAPTAKAAGKASAAKTVKKSAEKRTEPEVRKVTRNAVRAAAEAEAEASQQAETKKSAGGKAKAASSDNKAAKKRKAAPAAAAPRVTRSRAA